MFRRVRRRIRQQNFVTEQKSLVGPNFDNLESKVCWSCAFNRNEGGQRNQPDFDIYGGSKAPRVQRGSPEVPESGSCLADRDPSVILSSEAEWLLSQAGLSMTAQLSGTDHPRSGVRG